MCRGFVALIVAGMLQVSIASAQSLGTFKWQLQSYCNVISVVVTQTGGVYTLDGFDDQCGAGKRAPVNGLATPNPDGTIGMGLNIVAAPGGAPVHVAASIDLATLGGTWRDSAGATGNFVFTPGNGTGGSPRPVPVSVSGAVIPSAFALQGDGGFLAEGTLGQGNIPDSGPGTRLMWYSGKAALRAGQVTVPAWDDLNVGQHSAAFNLDTVASGARSVAFGHQTLASGPNSSAFGFETKATGAHATAIGTGTQANGFSSFATGTNTIAAEDNTFAAGFQTKAGGKHAAVFGTGSVADGFASFSAGQESAATGLASTAMGLLARAGGSVSVAMGWRVNAAGNGSIVIGSDAATIPAATGAIVLADRSSLSTFTGFTPNQFLVRSAGGVGIYTNSTLTAGAELAPGGSAWLTVSDVNMKENFRDLDDADVLSKIARMPIREWNYKAQDAVIRHIGPTAQDFRAAFGLGEDPLRISTIDADGVALRAIQALEARTREQNETLLAEIARLRARLERFEARER